MGYYGLPYENLPEYPKLVSISDIYDALTSNRPFRNAIPASFAMKAIVNTIDSHFDYELISDFINKVSPAVNPGQSFYAINDVCELSSSELALVKNFGIRDALKPKVLVFCKFVREGGRLNVVFHKKPVDVDLSTDPQRYITKILSNEQQLSTIKNNLKERGLL